MNNLILATDYQCFQDRAAKIEAEKKELKRIERVMKGFERWLLRTQDIMTPWTESEIQSFRKYIGYCGVEFPALREVLMGYVNNDMSYLITHEQSERGFNYLWNKCYKKNGELRNTKDFPFGERELNILGDFCHFKFVGIHYDWNCYSHAYNNTAPIYRVVSKSGDCFDYIAGSFGSIEVIG